ncbi:serine--tRNA ligase [Candidatus Nomurabacteria bacterium]|jgi:seryl-tRNA synthetase|nr:serine--tRNA ligase [Candidatus Saccharibacteria bacterium]MCB9822306.1 serine--tRNA ligase [Candidatus Nomurabacteria bacterium]MDQ5969672.1 seryl-tRNA synthetase [Patescibacteria group bacterium]
MLDIKFIRENAELVAEKALQKGYSVDVNQLLGFDKARLELQQQVEELRRERNAIADSMKGQKPSEDQVQKGKVVKEKLVDLEHQLTSVEKEFIDLLKTIPNMPLDSVPVGKSEDENVIIKTVGEKPEFNFKVKNHAQIAESKGWLDKERATKIAGARFVYTKGDLVRLEFALWQFGMSVLGNEEVLKQIIADNNLDVSSNPFIPILPPAVAKKEVFEATGRLNREEQTYKFEDEDLWMNASAEHTISPIYLNEILPESELPIRYVGYTTAFRKEAGTYGKDTEGIFRLHQFNKLEMESFCAPETSLDEHLFMVAIQEYLMNQLKLPYHVLEKCTADIGRPNAKGVDIEAWLPSQQTYRETHTADYITDYQARAMKTRVRRADGSVELLHTNDATAFSQRPLIAIIENYQTKEGDVIVPDVLRPFMANKSKI